MIVAAVVLFDSATPFPGLTALSPTLGTVLIIACSREGLWTYRLMAWRPVVQVGVMSYGFYLWHQPLFAYLRHAQLGAEVPGWQFGLAGVLAYGLAVLSY